MSVASEFITDECHAYNKEHGQIVPAKRPGSSIPRSTESIIIFELREEKRVRVNHHRETREEAHRTRKTIEGQRQRDKLFFNKVK